MCHPFVCSEGMTKMTNTWFKVDCVPGQIRTRQLLNVRQKALPPTPSCSVNIIRDIWNIRSVTEAAVLTQYNKKRSIQDVAQGWQQFHFILLPSVHIRGLTERESNDRPQITNITFCYDLAEDSAKWIRKPQTLGYNLLFNKGWEHRTQGDQ
jgi:hypothetical protein